MRLPRHWAYILLFVTLPAAARWLIPVDDVPASSGAPERPKLVVVVVFDQLRGDYLKKWQPLFGPGGFKRLQKEGAWYTDCHYPYAYTITAPGHASLVTGTTPSKHGIIGNEWYDRAQGENVTPVTPPPEQIAQGLGPYRCKSETVGDVLLRALKDGARIFSFSIKERVAILLAGMRAHLCCWFNTTNGNFVTSPYYYTEGHAWVTKFNKERRADRWKGKFWERFNPNLAYAEHSGPDDFRGEGSGYLQGSTFPHPFQLAETKDERANLENYYSAVMCSPMGNELLLECTKQAIAVEKLGQTDAVDLLCVGFTSNDYVGHAWGPDSQEVLDTTLRTDALMKDLLDFLDAKVGKNKYYVAVSADHGMCPLPEFASKQNKDAGRVDPEILTSKAEEYLNKKFLPRGEKAPWFIVPKRMNAWVYFNHATLKELKLKQGMVERALADWLCTQPGVETAITRSELVSPSSKQGKERTRFFESVQRSFDPDRSGDIMVILKPYHIFSPPNLAENPAKSPAYRATHGMPHPYDTHVPLLVMGPRVVPGIREECVAPQAMASILAEVLAIARPRDADYALPKGLLRP